MPKKELTTITRSFSLKKNLGNYETADFYCCQSAEVEVDIAEETSSMLYDFCKKEVVKSINEFLRERDKQQETVTTELKSPRKVQESVVYKASPNDSWRKKYMAGGTRDNPEMVEITDEALSANTSEPY